MDDKLTSVFTQLLSESQEEHAFQYRRCLDNVVAAIARIDRARQEAAKAKALREALSTIHPLKAQDYALYARLRKDIQDRFGKPHLGKSEDDKRQVFFNTVRQIAGEGNFDLRNTQIEWDSRGRAKLSDTRRVASAPTIRRAVKAFKEIQETESVSLITAEMLVFATQVLKRADASNMLMRKYSISESLADRILKRAKADPQQPVLDYARTIRDRRGRAVQLIAARFGISTAAAAKAYERTR